MAAIRAISQLERHVDTSMLVRAGYGVRVLNVRGCDIDYDRGGDGSDLIWAHGLTSSRKTDDEHGWFDWERLRRSARILRYDARGHGLSGSSVDPQDYSWENLARDQLALADAVGIERYTAGGSSMGCATALHAAVLAPERVRALVLVIPPTAWEVRVAQAHVYRAMAELIEIGDYRSLLEAATQRPIPDPLADDPAWAQEFPKLLAVADPLRLARVLRGASTGDLPTPEQIATIQIPTLILAWTGDPAHPVQSAARLQELIAGAELALAATPTGTSTWSDRIQRFVESLEAHERGR